MLDIIGKRKGPNIVLMSSEQKSWINWDNSPKWIGTAVAILLLLLKSVITYLWGLWQDKKNPQPPSQPPSKPGKNSPGVALNLAPVLLLRSWSCIMFRLAQSQCGRSLRRRRQTRNARVMMVRGAAVLSLLKSISQLQHNCKAFLARSCTAHRRVPLLLLPNSLLGKQQLLVSNCKLWI